MNIKNRAKRKTNKNKDKNRKNKIMKSESVKRKGMSSNKKIIKMKITHLKSILKLH